MRMLLRLYPLGTCVFELHAGTKSGKYHTQGASRCSCAHLSQKDMRQGDMIDTPSTYFVKKLFPDPIPDW